MAVHFFPEVNTGSTGSLGDYITLTEKGSANGVATLDGTSKIPSNQLPNIAITDTFIVNSELELLALTAQIGDVGIRTDLNKSFVLQSEPASVLDNWAELLTPTDSVLSVDGRTGSVDLADKYQVLSNELTAISALVDTPGFIKKTGDGTYTIDTNSYLTSNQTITLSGDVTGSGTNSIAVSIPSIPWSKITTTPTTLSGYGISDPLVTIGTSQTISGTKTFTGTMTGSRANIQLVLNQSGVSQPTALLSNQSGIFYFFCSDASASVNTTINALRPLTINLTSGLLNSSNGQNFAGGISSSGALAITNATASTSTTTGAITVLGGVGVQGDMYANLFNGNIKLKTYTTATRPVASAGTLGQVWLNTDTGKIEYVATASTIQVITSA